MPGDFDFRNLTPEVRQYMLKEIDQDVADAVLVKSKRFTEARRHRIPTASSEGSE